MNVEGLIAAVFARNPIWDRKSKLHSNRTVVDNCWRDIAIEMNEDEIKLRKKWKYLRDQFAVEYGKIPEEHGNAVTKWPHFKALLFLRDIIKPRQSNGPQRRINIEVVECSNEYCESSQPQDTIEFPEVSIESPVHSEQEEEPLISASSLQLRPSRKRHAESNAYNKLVDIEKQKLEYLQAKSKRRETEDEHTMFYKSLLPHIKKIPQHQQLLFRTSVQKLVHEFAYNSESTNPCTSDVKMNLEDM